MVRERHRYERNSKHATVMPYMYIHCHLFMYISEHTHNDNDNTKTHVNTLYIILYTIHTFIYYVAHAHDKVHVHTYMYSSLRYTNTTVICTLLGNNTSNLSISLLHIYEKEQILLVI